jgi:NhaP-type Na+/H+ or K+/H+ antiporter
VEDVRTLVALLGVLAYALLSHAFDRRWVSMPMVMIAFGLLAALASGGAVVDLTNETVKVAAELTLSLMLFCDAVRIDLSALRRGRLVPLRLLGIGLPVMIVLGTAVAVGLLPAIGLAGAALIATMLAPTDAALGEAVVSDKRVPVTVRQGLNVESGLNDGLSVPIFLVALAIAVEPPGRPLVALVAELAQQIGLGVVGGVLVGGVGGWLFGLAARTESMEAAWRRLAVLAAAVGCFVGAAVLGGSGFIGAFVGGIAFGLTSGATASEDGSLAGQLGTFFDAMSFMLVGAALLPSALAHLGWGEIVYAVASLVVLRMVSVAIAMLGSGARWPTVAFMGWFGPRGLATVVFTILLIEAEVPAGETIAAIAVLAVVLSAFAHGLTAPPLVAAYARWSATSSAGIEMLESAEATEGAAAV